MCFDSFANARDIIITDVRIGKDDFIDTITVQQSVQVLLGNDGDTVRVQ